MKPTDDSEGERVSDYERISNFPRFLWKHDDPEAALEEWRQHQEGGAP